MYKLTERRLEAARDILEQFRGWLYERGSFDAGYLEGQLRKCWDIGYQSLKDIMIDMFEHHPRYKYVAAWYMQHSNAPGVVSEFQKSLASLYHLRYFHTSERDDFGKGFWATFTSEDARKLRKQIDELRDEWERLDASGTQSEKQNQLTGSIERLQLRLHELTGEEY